MPQTVLDSLPEEIREQVEGTYGKLQQSPLEAVPVGRLAMVLHAYQQTETAEEFYREARRLASDAFEWVYYLAVVQSIQGKVQEAMGTFREAIQLNPEYLPARLKLAELAFESNEFEESRQVYEGILKDYPELALAHYGLGRTLVELSEIDSAVRHLLQACELYEGFGPAHYTVALAYRSRGDAEKAKEHFELYSKSRLTRPAVGDGMLDAISALKGGHRGALQSLQAAVEMADNNQIEASIQEHLKALEQHPELLKAHVNLIILYGQTDQPDQAGKHYQSAIAIDANSAEAHFNYGVMLMNRSRYDEAIVAFRKTLQSNPFSAPANNNLGQLLEVRGETAEAEKLYRAAIKQDPTYRIARFNLGRSLVASKKSSEAVEEFLKILEPDDEETPRYMYALASAYVRIGQFEKARHYTREAKDRAERHGQTELAKALDRDLKLLESKLK